jgi:coenzyme F420-0:L-glutamate ligase/coenzyme F420-1:gamma-L-glutamate ligase
MLNVFRLEGLPEFKTGQDFSEILLAQLEQQKSTLLDGDILVIAHKVISKCEGAMHRLADIEPTQDAIELAKTVNKDPRKVQVILDQSTRVVRAIKREHQHEGVLICEHKRGFICANAAVDESNTEQAGTVITLPDDADASARKIADRLSQHVNANIGVIISDTFGRPWRLGQTNVAIGLGRVPALNVMAGECDAYGRPLSVTAPAFADELAAASGLLMEKAAKTPVIIFRGLHWAADFNASSADLLRAAKEDLFR